MSGKAKALLTFTIVAFVVAALRFVPRAGISPDLADFSGGLGVGRLIGLVVTVAAERTPPD